MRKHIAVLLSTTLLLSVPVSASALTWQGHRAYVLRNHHAKCAANYHRETIRVKGKRVIGCVYVPKIIPVTPTTLPSTAPTSTTVVSSPAQTPPVATAPPVVTLKAHIDPTFTQDATNPLAVTYAASASATVTTNGATQQINHCPLACSTCSLMDRLSARPT